MRVVHLLRKYNPAEWGGTETAIQRLFDGLRQHRVTPINQKEAALLQEQYSAKRIIVRPHGVPASRYRKDHRETARESFPAIRGRRPLLAVGRIDPVKNQLWLIEQSIQER